MMSALPSAAAHLDYDQPRLGSGIPYSVPRGTYQCADGKWVAISTSAESVAHRVLELLGVGDDAALRDVRRPGRAPRRARRRGRGVDRRAAVAEVLAAFEAARGGDRARVLDARALHAIRTCKARDVFPRVDGVVQQGPAARLSRTPAELRWAGRALGADSSRRSMRPEARNSWDGAIQLVGFGCELDAVAARGPRFVERPARLVHELGRTERVRRVARDAGRQA